MATHAPSLVTIDPTKESQVGIALEPVTKGISVTRETFWLRKSCEEVAEWFCLRTHEHGKDSPCFTVKFDKDGTPFMSSVFVSNNQGYACSDQLRRDIVPSDRIYHYHVYIAGQTPLDPGGGVKP